MKTITKYILLFTTSIVLLMSCENVDFGDINTNPNEPSEASTTGLLASSLRSLGFHTTRTTPMLYTQYLSNGQYPDESRYSGLNWSYYSLYEGALSNLQRIIDLNEANENGSKNTVAVAMLAKAYFFHTMTDRWGYIPYTEALKGVEVKQPIFNSQEEVYKGLFKDIDEALAMINSEPGPKGDIIFGGKMAKWEQFANTMKVVMAIRLSKRDSDLGGYAKTQFNNAVSGAIKTAGDNIHFPFISGDENSDNPWEDRFSTRKDYLMSDVIVNFMIGNGSNTSPQDPRLKKYAQPVKGTDKFVGAPYGSGNDLVDNFSFITGDIINNQSAPGIIFTASQVYFSMAEAVELGWISGDAKEYFKKGIEESMKQWGVTDTESTAFVESISYNGIQSIAEQKWVALYMQGYESWAEWRRIGGPNTIKKPDVMINGEDIPQRQAYGSNVPSLNKVNYDKAISEQGADNLDTKLWWAK